MQETVAQPKSDEGVEALRQRLSDTATQVLQKYLAIDAHHPARILESDAAKKITALFTNIENASKNIEQFLRDSFSRDREYSDTDVQRIVANLLQRMEGIFLRIASDNSIPPATVIAELERVEIENELFVSAFKTLHESGGQITFADIRDADFRTIRGGEFAPEDVVAMRDIYAHNYAKKPELQAKLLSKFDEIVKSPETHFYVFRHKKRIRGFNAFTVHGLATEEFRAFNIDPAFTGAEIGEAMMLASLDLEAEHNYITADCAADAPIAINYIERGFVGTSLFSFKGDRSFHIERSDPTNMYYVGKRLSREEITDWANNGTIPPGTDEARVLVFSNTKELSAKSFGANNVLTRYFAEKSKVYAVFEPRQEIYIEDVVGSM